ncbi:MAG TPA: phycobilisome rod-core linker polypeptide [Vicinamibacterales bacterium]|jgi:Ca2+-binding EF-hand superfamily protein|nr:phycobilisome rod-core linker polypeptide [Vicinamibacterales bacterium]
MFRGLVFAGLLALAPSFAMAQQPCTTDARHVVDELYRHMLERTAGAPSQAWVDKLNSGMTVRSIVREIATSQEHMQRFHNTSEGANANRNSVATLYRHILGRQPDPAGWDSLTNLANQQGLVAVVDTIINSEEYTRTFGDWGVPGSGGLVYCGNSNRSASTASSQSNANSNPQMRFADLDRNHNGMIEKNEWRGSPRSFFIHDWNNDGVLSGDEVRVGAVPPAGSLEADDYNMSPGDRFSYLDVNNNGYIDRNEWDGSLDTFYDLDQNNDNRLTRQELNRGRRSNFAALDANGDGHISLGEWQWSHRSFDDMDTNKDGVIERNEFRSGAVPTSGR